jgi:threonine/homoserine/homoserine lactone efflux protein
LAAAGCTLGILLALATAALGLAAVLHVSALLFNIVKVASLAYLLWMACGALNKPARWPCVQRTADPIRCCAWRGMGCNQCSESQVVDLLSGILPPFLSGDASQATVEMATFGGGFMAVTFTVFAIYGLFAEALPVRLL